MGTRKENLVFDIKGHPMVYMYLTRGICSEVLDHLRKRIPTVNLQFSFNWQNGSSKFLDTGKLIPFIFKGTNMSLKI